MAWNSIGLKYEEGQITGVSKNTGNFVSCNFKYKFSNGLFKDAKTYLCPNITTNNYNNKGKGVVIVKGHLNLLNSHEILRNLFTFKESCSFIALIKLFLIQPIVCCWEPKSKIYLGSKRKHIFTWRNEMEIFYNSTYCSFIKNTFESFHLTQGAESDIYNKNSGGTLWQKEKRRKRRRKKEKKEKIEKKEK